VAPESKNPAGLETASLGAARAPLRGYLLVVRSSSSSRVLLPENGEITVGRGADCGVQLDDPGVSRRHAAITVSEGVVRLSDLGSRHGTTLNGLRLGAPRVIFSGDVIGVGDAVLVVHLPASQRPREIDGVDALERRVDQEIDRARAYDLRFSLLALGPFPSISSRRAAASALGQALLPRDMIAADDEGFVWAMLPELDGDEARERVAGLSWPDDLRPTVASYPADGCTSAALLRAARREALGLAEGARRGGDIVLVAPAMVRLYGLIRRLARSDLPVLIQGETGVGKEHAARAVHEQSPRAQGPFQAVNCAALPETLAESALFGHEKGSFSGATDRRVGLFEAADGGTLFLDEVGELPPALQAKLLRALETRSVTRLGSTRETAVDVRVVAATHRDLQAEAASGGFRSDLLFRLGACVVEIPPLRERTEEILPMARRFLDEARDKLAQPRIALSAEAAHRLAEHLWPGNIRELRNAVAYAAAIADGDALQPWDLPASIVPLAPGEPEAPAAPTPPAPPAAPTFLPLAEELRALERRRIEEALAAAGGVQRKAAALLHMPLRTFCMKLRQFGMTWPERWHKRD